MPTNVITLPDVINQALGARVVPAAKRTGTPGRLGMMAASEARHRARGLLRIFRGRQRKDGIFQTPLAFAGDFFIAN